MITVETYAALWHTQKRSLQNTRGLARHFGITQKQSQDFYQQAVQAGFITPKPTKYRSQKVSIDGCSFASKHEAERYLILRDQVTRGEIRDLRLQVSYPIRLNGILVCRYVADFVYEEGGQVVVEDAKSEATKKNRVYRLKYKLMQACYGITLRET